MEYQEMLKTQGVSLLTAAAAAIMVLLLTNS